MVYHPLKEDFLTYVKEVHWGGAVWCLVQLQGGGNWPSPSESGAINGIVADEHNDPCPATVALTFDANKYPNGKVLYQRSGTVVYAEDDAHTTAVYGVFADDTSNSNHLVAGHTGIDGIIRRFSKFPLGHIEYFDASNTAGIAAYAATLNSPGFISPGSVTYRTTTATVEAVYLLSGVNEFTVATGGYPFFTQMYLYPTGRLRVDKTNTLWGIQGYPPTGTLLKPHNRVYFPINWKTPVPPYPPAPGGVAWPGYEIVTAASPGHKRDVVNTPIFGIEYDTQGAAKKYDFKLLQSEHLTTPPDPVIAGPHVKDKIFTVYPTSVNAPDGDKWFVTNYCDVPFGKPFQVPDEWGGFSHLTDPGPLPKIAADITL